MSSAGIPIIELSGVSKTYGQAVRQQVLFDIDLSVRSGEFVALTGESGSGKTTLLNIMGLLDTPTTGELRLQGADAAALNETQRAALRRDFLGFIFQFHHLLPGFSVLDNALIPLLMRGGHARRANIGRVRGLLERVGLGLRLDHKPNQISGGQAQRAAIVRALANQPALVLADEPTGNLDSKTGREVLLLLRELNQLTGASFVMVTHHGDYADLVDRTIRMADGRIVEPTSGAIANASGQQGKRRETSITERSFSK